MSFFDWLGENIFGGEDKREQALKEQKKRESDRARMVNRVQKGQQPITRANSARKGTAPRAMSKPVPKKPSLPVPKQASPEHFQEERLIQDLINKIGGGPSYEMPAFNGKQYSEPALNALREALNGSLGALNDLRSNARSNYATSDRNLQDMHRAFQQDIQTKGAEAFRGIQKEHIGGIESATEDTTNRLQGVISKQQAERQAMLKNLGIQAAGADPKVMNNDILNEGISYANKHGSIEKRAANTTGEANLARNQGMATAVGSEGVERRSELERQLNSLLGQVDAKEAGVRSDYANNVSQVQMQTQAAEAQYQQSLNAQRAESAQAEMENARAMLDDIYKRRAARVQSEAEQQQNDLEYQRSLEKLAFEYQQKALLSDRNAQNRAQYG